MVTKRTGRPRGRQVQPFEADPDRYVIGMVDGLAIVYPSAPFEHLAMLALAVHNGDRADDLPDCPAAIARKQALDADKAILLEAGWRLQNWGDRRLAKIGDRTGADTIGAAVDRIRKKMKRRADDPGARRWRSYMSRAWACLLTSPNWTVIRGFTAQADEAAYAGGVMLRFAQDVGGL